MQIPDEVYDQQNHVVEDSQNLTWSPNVHLIPDASPIDA